MALAAGLILVLAACNGVASPAASSSSTAPMSMPVSVSATPSVSTAPSPSGPVRCAVTPDAAPSATIKIFTDNVGIFNFGDPVTIKAGQAVAFTNGNGAAHTITEGTYGQAVAGACVDVPIANSASVIVTFYLAGTYQITCKPHPIMQTSVLVQ
jgi:plastocyanin